MCTAWINFREQDKAYKIKEDSYYTSDSSANLDTSRMLDL